MIDTGAFKTAIVDLAVTGQLSAQFRADDSVEEIIAALPPLSNKRKKLLGQSFEYGKQASLPDHWRWICLGEISSYGDTPTKAYFDDVSGDTWLLDLEDIRSGGQIIKKTRVHGKKFIGDKTVFSEGQVLYSKLRPYLKKVLVADEGGISTPELISFDTYGGVIPQYVVYCLLSSFTDRAIEKRSYGIKMPRIDAAFMVNLPIPVPPVSEQHFIVDRVQEAFSQIDTIDGLQAQYADNLAVLKGKLIDAAIQGKLTEQLPEDGTAEDLYQHILRGLNQTDTSAEIVQDDLSLEIPANWRWIRLKDITSSQMLNDGDWVLSKDMVPSGPVKLIQLGNIGDLKYRNKGFKYLTKERFEELNGKQIYPGYLLINRLVADKMLVCIIPDIDGILITAVDVCWVAPKEDFYDIKYLMYALASSGVQQKVKEVGYGVTRFRISKTNLIDIPFPFPPLAEQKRIVDVLEAALTMTEV